ncbi:unnamed protein product [Albugo candida]|uniref:Uncharacterized protein n=2 Tax=Albugo candida TaxID=65357 RepID=A0A024G336_9STRA|nr:unnamed protein product [Albugo candida]|eukprot:CCI40942.1 unnamed protein product [Albugo candida]
MKMFFQRISAKCLQRCLRVYTFVKHRKWPVGLIILCVWLSKKYYTHLIESKAQAGKIIINHVDTLSSQWRAEPLDSAPSQERDIKADIVQEIWTDETFDCLGWQRLYTCHDKPTEKSVNPEGYAVIPRTPILYSALKNRDAPEKQSNFLNCSTAIGPGMAGYCAVRNRSSGQEFKLMVSTCDSIPKGSYTCEQARTTSDFAVESVRYRHRPIAPSFALSSNAEIKDRSGIVMIVYDKILPSLYASVRMLRLHGCELPIEMWYRPDEMSIDNPIIHQLLTIYNVRMRPIFDRRAKGFHVKPYALYYSNFDNVLLLDGDNIPTKDPTYLFQEPEFVRTGALFWPDYWQPSNSLFELTRTSLLWEITGVQYREGFEQESGQLLINRKKSRAALEKLMFYSTHEPRVLENLSLLWGDKDLFRLAWLNTSQPSYTIPYPPAVGGLLMEDMKLYCGLAMIQHDVQGNYIFFHRNTIKLDGSSSQTRLITHIQEYSWEADPSLYRVHQIIHLMPDCCYQIGTASADGQAPTRIVPIEETLHVAIEELAIAFSIEAKTILEEKNFMGPNTSANLSLGIHEIVILFLAAYVVLIVGFVWFRAKPVRERLPSRIRPISLKKK